MYYHGKLSSERIQTKRNKQSHPKCGGEGKDVVRGLAGGASAAVETGPHGLLLHGQLLDVLDTPAAAAEVAFVEAGRGRWRGGDGGGFTG